MTDEEIFELMEKEHPDALILLVNLVSFFMFLKMNRDKMVKGQAELKSLSEGKDDGEKIPESFYKALDAIDIFYLNMDIADTEINFAMLIPPNATQH